MDVDVFELAEKVELVVADIYARLSRTFHNDPDLRALFLMLADEERGHARRIRDFEQMWKMKGNTGQPALNVKRTEELLHHAETFLQKLEGVEEVEAETALRVAASLEKDFSEVHAEKMGDEGDPAAAKFFRELSAMDVGHEDLLNRTAERLRRLGRIP